MDLQGLLLTVLPILWGLVVKYHPAWARFPNAAINYVTMLAALLTKLIAPASAHAGDLSIVGVALIPLALPGWLAWSAPVLGAGWQAIQNSLIYEVFLRHPIAGMGISKA